MIRSVSGAEQGPTAEQQAYFFPRAGLLNQLGDPQDPTRVTFPFLKRMRRDHMVAMGLHYIATPIVSASYYFDCLAGDTRIAMADGSYKALEDIKPGDVILSSGGQSVTYDIVTATMMKGYREIVEVTLDDNRTLRCTPEHKIYGWDEWVEAKDLLPGDPVCVSGKHPDYPRQSENPDDAWLIGLWLAEGSKNHGSFMITCGTPGVRERLQEIADRRGWKLHCYPRIPIQMTLSAGRKKLGDTPNNLLRAFGVKGMTTKTISIPERIFKGDDETVGAFLSGYIAGDGCCNGERQLWSSSISRQMSKDIQLLVSRLGVRSNVYWHEHKTEFGHQPTWIWSVGDRKSLVKLASFLDVTGKQQQLEDLISRCTDGGGAARDSSIPLRYRMELKGSKTPVMTEKVRRTWRDSERALADAQRTGNTELEFKITNGLQWRKVKSVKSAGFEQVYDISTSATHAFFTEAGLVHNCENAQVAAFADNIIRPIYGRLTLVILRMLWAGYSPAAKNFETVNPNWTYLPGIDEDPLPVWDQGSVQALVYKPVTPLRPEVCRPVWDASGNFNGIGYDGRYGGPGYFTLNGQRTPDVDAAHAVWAVHDQDSESGSPWGFARVAYCAPIFHMYRYIWTLLGRAFENNADPGPVVRYPREDVPQVDADGNAVRNVDVALRIGRRRRSGSTVALPSESYVDLQDKPTGVQKWAIEYPKNETSFAEILKFIEFLEASKLRCVTADTPIDCPRDHVRYPDGIPISQIREGQLIWCFNEKTKLFELLPIKKVGPTRPDAELLKLTLDNGKTIRATPDHKFMTRDARWVELQDLEIGDSLMPLERDFEPFIKVDPYKRGWTRDQSSREYKLVAEANLGSVPVSEQRIHVHHVDDLHNNTSPDNLVYLTNSEHSVVTNLGTRRGPDYYQRVMAGMAERVCAECGVTFSPRGPTSYRCEPCQALARFEQIKSRKPQQDPRVINKPRICQGCEKEYMPTGLAQKWCIDCRAQKWVERSKANPVTEEDWLASLTTYKVAKIEPCEPEDTWDLSVDGPPECHSFVSQGVVLHNSLLISEQGLITSSGAQSNRNTMASASQQRNESQLVLMKQIIDVIEQVFVAPAIAMNMPWFEGNLSMRTVGFGDQEDDVVKQILQLEGQLDPRTFGVDVKRILASRGLPMYSAADYKKVEAQIAADPPQLPAVKPTEGRRALVTQTGFDRETGKPEMSYVQLGGRIELSDDGDFVASLPRTDAFADAKVLGVARSLRSTSSSFLSWLYGDFARYLGKQKNLDLTEVLEQVAAEHLSDAGVELAGADVVRAVVDRIMAGWRPSVDRIAAYSKAARAALGRVVDRTASLQLSRVGSKARASSLDEAAAAWLDDRGAELVSGVLDTTRKQIAEALADGVRTGQTTTQIAADLRAHFSDFPATRAGTIARNEINVAYLRATIVAGQAAGVQKVQLIDGTVDPACRARNGRIVSMADAAKEQPAHVNCTLTARLLPNAPTNLEVRREPLDGLMARYDPGSETVLLSPDISQEDESRYLIALGDSFAAPASQD